MRRASDTHRGGGSAAPRWFRRDTHRRERIEWHPRRPDCISDLPAFVIADSKDTKADDPKTPHIVVLGWARSFATVFDATQKYKGLKTAPKVPYKDEVWDVVVPFPIPAVGAKVKVRARYGTTFTKSSSGIVSDAKNGVLTYASLESLD